jgi:hypothetical protein
VLKAFPHHWAKANTIVNATYDDFEAVLLAQTPNTLRVLFVGDCLFTDIVRFMTPKGARMAFHNEAPF